MTGRVLKKAFVTFVAVLMWFFCLYAGFSLIASGDLSNADKTVMSAVSDENTLAGFRLWVRLAFGMTRTGGTVYAGDRLIKLSPPPDEDIKNRNIEAIKELTSDSFKGSYICLVPGEDFVMSEKLPAGTLMSDQWAFEKSVSDMLKGVCREIDLFPALSEGQTEGYYYKTDYLWTPKGAYEGYNVSAERLGVRPKVAGQFDVELVSHDFYGRLWRENRYFGFSPEPLELNYYPGFESIASFTVYTPVKTFKRSTPYYPDMLESDNPLKVYLGDDYPLMEVTTKIMTDRSLIVIGDEYKNALIPFLLRHFSEITIVNTDTITKGMYDIIKKNQRQILFLFGADNFGSRDLFTWLDK